MDYAAMAHHSAAAMANPDPLHYLHHHHQESVKDTCLLFLWKRSQFPWSFGNNYFLMKLFSTALKRSEEM